MIRPILAAALLTAPLLAGTADAQTANAGPTFGAAGVGGNVFRTAPSGGTAVPNPGQPQAGAPTPLEQQEEHKSRKDTGSVCKGC